LSVLAGIRRKECEKTRGGCGASAVTCCFGRSYGVPDSIHFS
jgi:hypothetical protein